MPADPRIQQLLDALIDPAATPEEVCRSCPELLPEVQVRWQRMCRLQAELDMVFPPEGSTDPASLDDSQESSSIPAVPGYEVKEVLGRGGMGIVFLARHLRLNRIVAMKMTLAGAYAGPLERSRFQREAEAVARLQHPNVVQVYEVGDSNGRPYFTMEYVAGGSLGQKLSGAPQPAREAATLMGALAGAVQVAHESGVVHRDLKPANVLLTADGTPKISDFGLARRLDGDPGLTWTGTAIGTPSYMAPEQAWGKKDAIGPATDIYSLGAILYEMLTGRPPFRGESAAATVEQVITRDPVPPSRLNPTVPRDLETICLKCLQKEPRLRYATAAALADDLNCFLRGEAIAARPEGRLSRIARRVRRRPALVGALALAIVSIIALVGGGLWRLSERAATARVARETARDELDQMVSHLRASNWSEARAARDRAITRLGNHASAELQLLVDQGGRDLDLVDRLNELQVKGVEGNAGEAPFASYAREFDEVFRDAALGTFGDDPEIVAKRISESNIRSALIIALDRSSWPTYYQNRDRCNWALKVAQKSDPDQSTWRVQARDPKILDDRVALAKVFDSAPINDLSVISMLAFGRHLFELKNSEERIATLMRRLYLHPNDFWVNFQFGRILLALSKHSEAVGYFQAAVALQPDSSYCRFYLGASLRRVGRVADALDQFRQAINLRPTVPEYHLFLADVLAGQRQYAEAIEHLRYDDLPPDLLRQHRELFAKCLRSVNANEEALVWYKKIVQIDPKRLDSQRELRSFLMQLGRVDEVRVAWQAAIACNPQEHDACYGCAEWCLFIGNESEYIRSRRDLLARFGASTDPQTAERTSRACLLLPPTDEELRKAVALIDRAVGADPAKNPAYPYFLFVKGLSEFRQGQFDKAIAILRGDASRILGPAPRLVLAMALFRKGEGEEARRTLAAAIVAHNWRPDAVHNQDDWIFHVLRREAERLIVPNISKFLAGEYQPRNNDERLALIGVCQYENRYAALARLYTDIFAADRHLEEDTQVWHRWEAASAAALAGCGRCVDAKGLDEAGRRRWRDQARRWLRADLAKLSKPQADAAIEVDVKKWLISWQADTDLAGLREPAELAKLSEDERKDCLAFWNEVADAIKRK